jgi:diguanylate cyclase (GGDEF)-like protein
MGNKKSLVLVVDDNSENLKVLGGILKNNTDYKLAFAMNGEEAVKFAHAHEPDMVLLDVMMPGMDGFEVCSLLKNDDVSKDIPVIFITAKTEPDDIVKGFSVGGVDYITKPFHETELLMRIRTHMELKNIRDALEDKNRELSEAYEKIEELALTDSLTGIPNRRNITSVLHKEVSRSSRNGYVFSMIMCDIDFFKKVNDNYGHDVGDYVLQRVSKILKKNLREQDVVSRWGGEEFLIMLPDTELDSAFFVAEKLRVAIKDAKMEFEEHSFGITMTFGVSEFNRQNGLEKSIKKADDALYEGKQTGRDKVVAH